MSEHRIHCTNPDCARSLRVPDQALGRRIRCPACHQEIRVPGTIDELRALDTHRYSRVRVVRGPAFVDRVQTLEPERGYSFGRSDESDVQLPGPTVSKRHFSLHWVNHQWVLEDLNTTTGTLVNGLAVTKHALRGGDTIEVGAYTLEFLAPGEKLDAAKSACPVVLPAGDVEPLPLHTDAADADRAVREAEQRLRAAQGYTDFHPEHLEAVGRESSQRYTFSLATRLIAVAVLLVAATALSLFGKSWLSRADKPERTKVATTAAPEPLPAAFEEAVAKDDFAQARALLAQWKTGQVYADSLCTRMEQRLTGAIRDCRAALYQQAQQAQRNESWAQVKQLVQAAQAPALGPLPDEWTRLRDECRQYDLLVEAEAGRKQQRWGDALAKLEEAEKVRPGSPRVAEYRHALEAQLGAGLVVTATPRVEGVRVAWEGKALPAERESWGFPPGQGTVTVEAPGFFQHEEAIELRSGRLTAVNVALTPLAPPAVWALLALRRADAPGPLWLAAKHYGESDAVPPALTASLVAQSEGPAARKHGRSELRVARLTLAGGEQLTARVWSASSTGLTVQVFPKGDTRVIRSDDVVARQDLDDAAAAETVLAWITARRAAGLPLLETIEQLAKLRLDLASREELATRVAGSFVAACLRDLERCCGYCAGMTMAMCSTCAGKGFALQTVTCERCNGMREVNCAHCKGSGRVKCEKCGGDGTITKLAGQGAWKRNVEEPCPTCRASGQVACIKCRDGKLPCAKCKSSGWVEDKVSCPDCKKGLVSCPACAGTGTKDGMLPEKRREAEREAVEQLKGGP